MKESGMGLFDKKLPDFGEPVLVDMRIADEQLPAEVLDALKGQMWFMGFPEKLSSWAIDTLGVSNHPDVQIFYLERDINSLDPKKKAFPVEIEPNLLAQISGVSKERDLLLDFDEWQRAAVIEFEVKALLAILMEREGVTEKTFHALLVPDYSGQAGPPGHEFIWLLILHPEDYNELSYVLFGHGPMLTHPSFGGYDIAVRETLAIVNAGKAVPGLIKVKLDGDYIETDCYLPTEVVEAAGWWPEEVEGIPDNFPRSSYGNI
jgi:hypothetical protein